MKHSHSILITKRNQNFLTRLTTISLFLLTLFSCTVDEKLNESVLSSENTSLAVISGGKYYLKGSNNNYVSHENGINDMVCNIKNPTISEQFYLREGSEYWSITAVSTNLFVSSEDGRKDITCNRTGLGRWEKFDIENNGTANGNDLVAFKSQSNGKYISSESGRKDMICNRSSVGAWEKFELVPVDEETPEENNFIKLNLRVHIMKSSPWVHPSGVEMNSWVTPSNVTNTILPELNSIWSQAGVEWNLESVLEEDVAKFDGYEDSINFVINTARDENGRSDPARLPHLYDLMPTASRGTANETDLNLFHIYLFPFIGNTSQGNAMKSFNNNSVLGTWSNKHNGGGNPERTLLTENQDSFVRGSLSRTMAHELGHILNLAHSQCDSCLMSGNRYSITEEQIEIAQLEANRRDK